MNETQRQQISDRIQTIARRTAKEKGIDLMEAMGRVIDALIATRPDMMRAFVAAPARKIR